jgi:hypothetical protein
VKKRSIMSLVAGGLLAMALPGVAAAQAPQADGTTPFTVPALDYAWDGRLASNLTLDYDWDNRLASSYALDYDWDNRLASSYAPDLALTN